MRCGQRVRASFVCRITSRTLGDSFDEHDRSRRDARGNWIPRNPKRACFPRRITNQDTLRFLSRCPWLTLPRCASNSSTRKSERTTRPCPPTFRWPELLNAPRSSDFGRQHSVIFQLIAVRRRQTSIGPLRFASKPLQQGVWSALQLRRRLRSTSRRILPGTPREFFS
jgi:hypothetical protein